MKWTARRTVGLVEKSQSEGNWDRWFAWYPVRVARRDSVEWIWLQFVERKWRTSTYGSGRKQRRYRLPVDSKPNVQQRLHNLTELTGKLDAALRREKAALRRNARSPLRPQRNVILGLLLALAAAAWVVLVRTHTDSNMDMTASVTLGPRMPLFLAIWVIMMVAMMLPTAAPMILTFHRVQAANRQPGAAVQQAHLKWAFSTEPIVWAAAGFSLSSSFRSAS